MQDTIALLKETNSGCKSATNAIERILPHIKDHDLHALCEDYNARHAKIGEACTRRLHEWGADEKDPHPVSSAMSKMGISMSASWNPTTNHLADMLAEGCSMGIRSLSRYQNQYTAADPVATSLTNQLIDLEQDFFTDLRPYL